MKTLFAGIMFIIGYFLIIASSNAEFFTLSWFGYTIGFTVLITAPTIEYWESFYNKHFNKKQS